MYSRTLPPSSQLPWPRTPTPPPTGTLASTEVHLHQRSKNSASRSLLWIKLAAPIIPTPNLQVPLPSSLLRTHGGHHSSAVGMGDEGKEKGASGNVGGGRPRRGAGGVSGLWGWQEAWGTLRTLTQGPWRATGCRPACIRNPHRLGPDSPAPTIIPVRLLPSCTRAAGQGPWTTSHPVVAGFQGQTRPGRHHS